MWQEPETNSDYSLDRGSCSNLFRDIETFLQMSPSTTNCIENYVSLGGETLLGEIKQELKDTEQDTKFEKKVENYLSKITELNLKID